MNRAEFNLHTPIKVYPRCNNHPILNYLNKFNTTYTIDPTNYNQI